jgi:hypothetical protein
MRRDAQIAPPTLEQMRQSAPWLWVNCTNARCLHKAPMALVPLIIRWGGDASSDRLRACARCTRCGARGASLQHPSWGGCEVGWMPFPAT